MMKNNYLDDQSVQSIISDLNVRPSAEVFKDLLQLEVSFPADERVNYLKSILYENSGAMEKALTELWNCLGIQPQENLYIEAISKIISSRQNNNESEGLRQGGVKLWKYNPGNSVDKKRIDSIIRYKYIGAELNKFFGSSLNKLGLDLFCGNGYGTKLIHNLTGSRLIGVHNNVEIVAQANSEHGNSRILFVNKNFPLCFRSGIFDYSICHEVLEFFDDHEYILRQLIESTRGPIFVAAPSESGLILNKNKSILKNSIKHIKIEDIEKILKRINSHKIKEIKGQILYKLKNDVISSPLEQEGMYLRPISDASQYYLMTIVPK